MVIGQLVSFYTSLYPGHMNNSRDYKLAGKGMYKKYPCIMRAGKESWTIFAGTLSDRLCLKLCNIKKKRLGSCKLNETDMKKA